MTDVNDNTRNVSFGTKNITGPDTIVNPSEMGGLIGKGASGIKLCISNTWRLYDKLQNSENKVIEEKPTLRIVFRDGDESSNNLNTGEEVWVDIISNSETMLELGKLSVKKHIIQFMKYKEKNNKRKSLMSHSFVIDFPNMLIGRLIGKQGNNLKQIINQVIYENKQIQINEEDVATAKTARLKVDDKIFTQMKTIQEIIDYVNDHQNTNFIGWPPQIDDEYTDYILITLSFNRNANPFKNKPEYIERIQSILTENIQEIKNHHEDEMNEINECLGFEN